MCVFEKVTHWSTKKITTDFNPRFRILAHRHRPDGYFNQKMNKFQKEAVEFGIFMLYYIIGNYLAGEMLKQLVSKTINYSSQCSSRNFKYSLYGVK